MSEKQKKSDVLNAYNTVRLQKNDAERQIKKLKPKVKEILKGNENAFTFTDDFNTRHIALLIPQERRASIEGQVKDWLNVNHPKVLKDLVEFLDANKGEIEKITITP